jgi:hypothetical protein
VGGKSAAVLSDRWARASSKVHANRRLMFAQRQAFAARAFWLLLQTRHC